MKAFSDELMKIADIDSVVGDWQKAKSSLHSSKPHSMPSMPKPSMAPSPAPTQHNFKPIAPSQVNTSGMSMSMKRAVQNMR